MKLAKRTLATFLAVLMTLGLFAVGGSALAYDGPDIAPYSDGPFGAGNNNVFGTGWPNTFLNWILFYVAFGWIWMWFVPPFGS